MYKNNVNHPKSRVLLGDWRGVSGQESNYTTLIFVNNPHFSQFHTNHIWTKSGIWCTSILALARTILKPCQVQINLPTSFQKAFNFQNGSSPQLYNFSEIASCCKIKLTCQSKIFFLIFTDLQMQGINKKTRHKEKLLMFHLFLPGTLLKYKKRGGGSFWGDSLIWYEYTV